MHNLTKALSVYALYVMGHIEGWTLSDELFRLGFQSWSSKSDLSLKLVDFAGRSATFTFHEVMVKSTYRVSRVKPRRAKAA